MKSNQETALDNMWNIKFNDGSIVTVATEDLANQVVESVCFLEPWENNKPYPIWMYGPGVDYEIDFCAYDLLSDTIYNRMSL
jgi:hypothetical protein